MRFSVCNSAMGYTLFYSGGIFMVVGIIGSSSVSDCDLEKFIKVDKVSHIITGCEKDIHKIALKYADKHNISCSTMRPDIERYGPAAYNMRDLAVVSNCDKIYVFWDGKSEETKYIVDFGYDCSREMCMIVIIYENENYLYK